MSDLGLLATQLAHTTRYAEELDRALMQLKKARSTSIETSAMSRAKKTLGQVSTGLLASLDGNVGVLGFQLREETVQNLRTLHRTDWADFVETLKTVQQDLETTIAPSEKQLKCFEDVAQALDVACSLLFQRMQRQHR